MAARLYLGAPAGAPFRQRVGFPMRQIAIFVDAGYLYAQGSQAVTGRKAQRTETFLDVPKALGALSDLARTCMGEGRILRTYWYDGLVRSGRPTADHQVLAASPYCKLRLSLVNSQGEQKGVDALLVTDLIELARNRAITDALILSGDEDIRIGVQIAQTFGVQVHLLGIHPARGSQSRELIAESDTHHEWDSAALGGFLTVQAAVSEEAEAPAPADTPPPQPAEGTEGDRFPRLAEREISVTLNGLSDAARAGVLRAFAANPGVVPQEVDRPTLARIGLALDRQLNEEEKREFRSLFRMRLRAFLAERASTA